MKKKENPVLDYMVPRNFFGGGREAEWVRSYKR